MSYHGLGFVFPAPKNLFASPTGGGKNSSGGAKLPFTEEFLLWSKIKLEQPRLTAALTDPGLRRNRNLTAADRTQLRNEAVRVATLVNRVGRVSGAWTSAQNDLLRAANSQGGVPSDAAMQVIDRSRSSVLRDRATMVRQVWDKLAGSLSAGGAWASGGGGGGVTTLKIPFDAGRSYFGRKAGGGGQKTGPTPEEVAAAAFAEQQQQLEEQQRQLDEQAALVEAERAALLEEQRQNEEQVRQEQEAYAPPPPLISEQLVSEQLVPDQERKIPWLWIGLGAAGLGAVYFFMKKN